VCRDRADLRLLLARRHRPRERAERLDRSLGRTIQSALDLDRARAGNHIADAFREDSMGQNGRGARSVAGHVAGLFGSLPQHSQRPDYLPDP